MYKYLIKITIATLVLTNCAFAESDSPKPFGPIPSENQMRWQEMEFYGFIHFGLNTYTDQSWGYGDEDLKLFNPKKLDVRQWARIAKQAGMKGLILTAKHHSGFSLWPSKYTEYSVKNAPWKNGKGDLVRELADACKEYGLKFGIYLSPWDRNNSSYGKPEYITYFRNQLTELLTHYGPVFEVWFDGANGGTGYYGGANETRTIDPKTYYDWANTYKLVRKLQPDAVIWNDGGDRGDLRWVGTEAGYVGETNWSLLNAKGDVSWGMLHYGLESGDSWVPAEVNTSIRPEWFYHPAEDSKVKSVTQLLDTYYHSVGRNATMLLNFPIMPNGLIHENDEKAILEMAQVVKETFAHNLAMDAGAKATSIFSSGFGADKAVDDKNETYWATADGVINASLTISFDKPAFFNRFMVQEYIRLGQRVKGFTVEVFKDKKWIQVAKGTTIGYKRILRFPGVTATKVRLNITDSKANPLISNIGIYNAPIILNPPAIHRNQAGDISISADDVGPIFFYTTDGGKPSIHSSKYAGPVSTSGKIEVKAIAYDPSTGKMSPVARENFDIPRKSWKIIGTEDSKAYALLDGDPTTVWHPNHDLKLPIDLAIDLGSEYSVSGFKYFPDQGMWGPGIITHYEFYASKDNKKWQLVNSGEFSNIKNNPVWQIKNFSPTTARYIKLRALKNTEGNNNVGYAELDVITN